MTDEARSTGQIKRKGQCHRLTLDIPTGLYDKLRAEAVKKQITVRQLCERAIHNELEPPIQIYQRLAAPTPLTEYLEDAKEIVMVGVALPSVTKEREFFEKKALEPDVSMTFIVVDPDLAKEVSNSVIQIIKQRHDRHFPNGGIVAEIEKTVEFVKELDKIASGSGSHISILGTPLLPMCGLTIADPLTPHSKIRALLYLHDSTRDVEPILEIKRSAQRGDVYDRFYRHYEAFARDARSLLSGQEVGAVKFLERSSESRKGLLAERGGVPLPSSYELINEARQERSPDL